MDINFPLILTWAVLISGALVLFDFIFLAGSRRKKQQAMARPGMSKKEIHALVKKPTLIEYADAFFPVLLVVFVLRSFLAEPFQIPSGSMLPTLEVGDFILVNKFAYGIRLPVIDKTIINVGSPQRGDVMVFKFPEDPAKNFIKRVVGLPGDHIRYQNKTLYVNGEAMPQTFAMSIQYPERAEVYNEKLGETLHTIQKELQNNPQDYMKQEWSVPEGAYFVMGDNRDNSNDSRFWGFVPEKYIVGKAFYVWMHWESWSSLPNFSRNGHIQ